LNIQRSEGKGNYGKQKKSRYLHRPSRLGSIYEEGEGVFTLSGLRSHPSIDHGKGHSDKTIIPEGRKIGVDYSKENRSTQEEKEMKGSFIFILFQHNLMTRLY
jgi:hypothetical protein